MSSVNKVILLGRLGRDPEMRQTQSGTAVTTVSVATDEKWTDKSGTRQEKTEWHRVVLWGRLAEVAAQYLAKGSLAYFEGRLQTREWEQDGNKRYTTEIVATEMKFLSTKEKAQDAYNRPPDEPPSHGEIPF